MKVWKKFSAIALTLVMALALCATALADDPVTPTNLTDGEVGGYTTATKDTPSAQTKVINIQKAIKVYNPDETMVYGPVITYTYTIAPAADSELVNVTDDTTDHANGVAVTKQVAAGVTKNVVVNSGTAGSDSSATGTLGWTNTDILDASSTGVANIKNVPIDFSNVVFTEPGIYRYKITETANAYTTSGVIDGNGNTANIRYLDVYVMRSSAYNPTVSGETTTYAATDWTIYGYVCVANGTTAVTSTATELKTNGFVGSPDEYHTYNLTVQKTLSSDTTMESHKFPFTVAFTAGDATGAFQLIAEVTGNAEVTTIAQATTTTVNGTTVAADALTKVGTPAAMGSYSIAGLKIPHGGTAKFIGIPSGTKVAVTETNDVAGTTYSTSVTEQVGSSSATPVTLTTSGGTLSDDSKSASIDNGDTATYTQTTAPIVDNNAEIVFTNLLAIISPTGVTLRYAPYLAMMGAGIVALPLSLRKKEELF